MEGVKRMMNGCKKYFMSEKTDKNKEGESSWIEVCWKAVRPLFLFRHGQYLYPLSVEERESLLYGPPNGFSRSAAKNKKIVIDPEEQCQLTETIKIKTEKMRWL